MCRSGNSYLHEAEAFILSIAATKCPLQEYAVCICRIKRWRANRTVIVKFRIDHDGRLSSLHTERMSNELWHELSKPLGLVYWIARSGRPNKLTETSHRLPLSQAGRGSHRTTAVYEDSAKSSTEPNY